MTQLQSGCLIRWVSGCILKYAHNCLADCLIGVFPMRTVALPRIFDGIHRQRTWKRVEDLHSDVRGVRMIRADFQIPSQPQHWTQSSLNIGKQ